MNQPAGQQQRADCDGPWLSMPLLSLGTLHLRRGECRQIATHRYMLLVYMALLPVLVVLDTNPQAHGQPVELRGPVYIIALATMMLTIGGAVEIAFRLGWKRLALSPVLAVATLAGLAAGEVVSHLLFPAQGRGAEELALVCGFYIAMSEFMAGLVLHNILPRALGELRHKPIRSLAETSPAFTPATAGHTAPPDAAPDGADGADEDGILIVGNRSFAFASLRHLQAYGNYVLLNSKTGKELVAGPLSRLVAQIPPAYGVQVHRSHWIATSALRGWTASGRDIDLWIDTSSPVPVAVTRRREVRDWLSAHGIRQGKPV